MKTQSFLKGAAILTVAGLISKLLGALYRIPFFRVVGPEGMGLYQMAYPLYTMLLAVSSAGIPVAVSKLVSESLARRDYRAVNRTFWISLIFISLVSGMTSLFLYKMSFYLANNILHDARASYSIDAIAPAVFFVGILSVFRGYFQGFQEMAPTACSQVLEQIVRVGTVLIGAFLFLPKGIEFAAAAATFGAVTGAAGGALFLAALYIARPFFGVIPTGYVPHGLGSFPGIFSTLRQIVALALPISLGGLVVPVMQTLDALTVPGRLQLAGYSVSRAAQLYGELTGGAATLINLPTVITISLAASLVPAISGSLERKNISEVRRQANVAMEITVLVCLPATVGLAVLAVPISDLLFKCPEAGIPLACAAPAALLLGLHQTTAGILQGMGRTLLPVANLTVGAFIKFIANYTLTAMPDIGILGAAVGTVCGFLVSSNLNIIMISRFTGWRPEWRSLLLKPGLAVTIMAAAVYFAHPQFRLMVGGSWATVISIVLGFMFYVFGLTLTGTFRNLGFPPVSRVFRGIFGR